MTINDDQADELFRSELSSGTEGWHASDAQPPSIPARGWRPTLPAAVAAGIAALLMVAVSAGAYTFISGHRPTGGRLAPGTSSSASPSDKGGSPSVTPSATATTPVSGSCGSSACASAAPCATSSCPPTCARAQPCPLPPPTGSPAPAGGSECAPSEVDVAVTTDHQSYPPGAGVTITATIHNHSSRACNVPVAGTSSLACTPAAHITQDATGRVVWYSRNPMIMAPCYLAETTLAPNASTTQKWTWNQQMGCYGASMRPGPCQTGQAPAGSYTVHVSWINEATHGVTVT
jgi:hypothetical protein